MSEIVNNKDIREIVIEHPSHLQRMLLCTMQGLMDGTIDEKRGNAISRAAEVLIKDREQHWGILKEAMDEQRRQSDSAKVLLLTQSQ